MQPPSRLSNTAVAATATTAARLISAIVLLCVLVAVLRNLYRAIFLDPRSEAIARDLATLYNDDEENEENNDDDEKSSSRRPTRRRRRYDAVIRLRERLGVGLDSLPTVKFAAAVERNDRDHENDDDDDDGGGGGGGGGGDAKEERVERILRERQRECLTHGAFVSAADEFVDCRAYCSVSDGVEYRYYERLGSLLNGRRGRVGAYCLPTDAAMCNPNTSLTVYGSDGWRCMPQMRAFAGAGGDLIVACDGRLVDRATGRVWLDRIDSTLALDSIDEPLQWRRDGRLPPGYDNGRSPGVHGEGEQNVGDHRFVCPPSRDARGNLRVEAPFDRLFLLENTCASLIPHADERVRPNFAENRCECGEHATYDPVAGTCIPLGEQATSDGEGRAETFDGRTLSTELLFARPAVYAATANNNDDDDYDVVAATATSGICLEPWMTLSQAGDASAATTMCGVEHDTAGSGAAQVAYRRTRVLAFDRVAPSPSAMLLAAPSLSAAARIG